jgi:hypothetical protein
MFSKSNNLSIPNSLYIISHYTILFLKALSFLDNLLNYLINNIN